MKSLMLATAVICWLSAPALSQTSSPLATQPGPGTTTAPMTPSSSPPGPTFKGIPGFLDPSNGKFTPLNSVNSSTAAKAITGGVVVDIHLKLKAIPVERTACTVLEYFGYLYGNPAKFYSQATESSQDKSLPPTGGSITNDFQYTPSGSETPVMQIAVVCTYTDTHSNLHRIDWQSGNLSVKSVTTTVSLSF